jgi:hypothetical protein
MMDDEDNDEEEGEEGLEDEEDSHFNYPSDAPHIRSNSAGKVYNDVNIKPIKLPDINQRGSTPIDYK